MKTEINFQSVLSEMGKVIDEHGEECAQKVFKFITEINEVAQRTDDKVRNIGAEMIWHLIKGETAEDRK